MEHYVMFDSSHRMELHTNRPIMLFKDHSLLQQIWGKVFNTEFDNVEIHKTKGSNSDTVCCTIDLDTTAINLLL